MRVVLQRKLGPELTATLDYGYGGVLDLNNTDVALQDARRDTYVRDRHTAAAKFSGVLPGAKTRWIASYRWISGQALTPVDMFNESAGQADPFLNIFLRQPIPGTGFLPCHMDAVVDVRNLLAQGYVPVMGQDGRNSLSGAIGAHGSRRRGVYVLDFASVFRLQTSRLQASGLSFSVLIQNVCPPHP